MPFVRARLRDQLVYARADERGQLAVVGGRVEVRYKPGDGRSYQAGERNLTIVDATLIPNETVEGSAGPAAQAPEASAKPKARSRRSSASKESGAAEAPTEVTPGGAVIVYTDGACTGNPGPAGLGVVVVGEKGRIERSEYLGKGTNNIAELTAIQRALEMTDGPVVIHTDSQYAIGVLTKNWKAKANTALVEGIRGLLGRRSGVRFVYVRGHAGVPLNERADELARMAISTGQTRTEQV